MPDILVVCVTRRQLRDEFRSYVRLVKHFDILGKASERFYECVTTNPKLHVRFITEAQYERATQGFRGEIMRPSRFWDVVEAKFKPLKEGECNG